MMDDMIRGLDDSQAVRVLTTFARVRLRAGGVAETEWTPELDRALRQDFPAEADAGRAASVSEGDLARQALLLLADDPQNREALAALIEGPPPESFSRGRRGRPHHRRAGGAPDPRALRAGQGREDPHQDREEADPGQPAEGSRAEAAWFFLTNVSEDRAVHRHSPHDRHMSEQSNINGVPRLFGDRVRHSVRKANSTVCYGMPLCHLVSVRDRQPHDVLTADLGCRLTTQLAALLNLRRSTREPSGRT